MASDSEEAPFARAVLITLAVLALYVLSMGPVYRASLHDNLDGRPIRTPRWLDTAYYPITWTADHCDPVDKALQWYLYLWRPI